MLVNYPQCALKKAVMVVLRAQAPVVGVEAVNVKKHLVHMD